MYIRDWDARSKCLALFIVVHIKKLCFCYSNIWMFYDSQLLADWSMVLCINSVLHFEPPSPEVQIMLSMGGGLFTHVHYCSPYIPPPPPQRIPKPHDLFSQKKWAWYFLYNPRITSSSVEFSLINVSILEHRTGQDFSEHRLYQV